GSGPGAGMALMFVISGALGILVGFGGYAISIVRNVEDILPDHVTEVEPSDRREPEDFRDKSNS
ncbi:MAG: hypothetical protein JSV57_01750, partial [Candidatus Bathyarchaeota archaeon]